MHLNIQGRHFAVTPALNTYVKAKLKKIKYYFDHIIHVHVVLATEKNDHIAEATITVERHHFHNKIITEDMYKSIDDLFDKIEIQVRRYKEYLQDRKKRNYGNNHVEELARSQSILKEEKPVDIKLKEIPFSVKPKDAIETALQLQALSDVHIAGFYSSAADEYMSYMIEHAEKNRFSLLQYDHVWERQEICLKGKDVEVISIENVRPPMELIEDAVEYLLQHENDDFRFFISARTHESALLFHQKKNIFELIREKQ